MPQQPKAPQLSTRELAQVLEAGDAIQLLDVRAPARVEVARIHLVPDGRFHNMVGSKVITLTNLGDTGLDPEVPVAVVCWRGIDSSRVALHLNKLGCSARSLNGGMAAWMMLTLPRELEAPPLDRLIQFDRIGKGALGYLLVSDRAALIIDPPRDPSSYLDAAAKANAEVVGVADTHAHADYISGATELARTLGVPYYLHPADAVYPYDGTSGKIEFQALEDGATIKVGRCTVRAIHTPGHTEGSLTYLVDDHAAFTGDFLFVDSIGRPDLAGKVSEWTAQLWHSLEAAKRQWSQDLMILPAHYGSESERRQDRSIGEPFRHLLQHNESLGFENRQEFNKWVESKTASCPDAYRKIKAINVGLIDVNDLDAEELEVGKNECALGGR